MSEWREVWSRAVQAIAHDPERNELRVRWSNGKVSVYGGVDAALHDEIRKAPSVGGAIWSLRGLGHAHRYESDETAG